MNWLRRDTNLPEIVSVGLTVVFTIIKLMYGYVSWWFVFSPMIAVACLLILCVVYIVVGFVWYSLKAKFKEINMGSKYTVYEFNLSKNINPIKKEAEYAIIYSGEWFLVAFWKAYLAKRNFAKCVKIEWR